MIQGLDQVNPQFRHLTDILLFTDRTDEDWSNYRNLLESNGGNLLYLLDTFLSSIRVFWSEEFWTQRLDFLLSLQNPRLQQVIDFHMEARFRGLVRGCGSPSAKLHNEYMQFIALCKVKSWRKESLSSAKKFLLELPNTVAVGNLLDIVNHFIPTVYVSLDDYGDSLSREVLHSVRAFDMLETLEKQGIPVNRELIHKVAKDLFFGRSLNRKNRNSLFNMMKNGSVRDTIKSAYKEEHRPRLMELIDQCDFREIEHEHMINIKSILDIDCTIADQLLVIYADKLHTRGAGSKKANIDRIVRVLKTFPQCSPKKVLAYLSNNNRMSDIKYLMRAFPDLRKLAAFI
jgi:hypothetical protein